MSELMQIQKCEQDFRWHLMSTVSAFALIVSVLCAGDAVAADSEREASAVWVELGGVLERVDGGNRAFAAPFMLMSTEVYSQGTPIEAQRAPRYAVGGEGKISFAPKGSDWSVSVGIRYGRASNKRDQHFQTFLTYPFTIFNIPLTPSAARFSENKTSNREGHFILDFQAGLDVGLGMFGRGSTSVVSAGVRFAEFTSKSQGAFKARPDVDFYPYAVNTAISVPVMRYLAYKANAFNARSFKGIGPAFSWNASSPLAQGEDAQITLDWGVNAAILFGRQKAKGTQQAEANEYRQKYYDPSSPPNYGVINVYDPGTIPHNRSRSVAVPNLGAFAGLSYRYQNAKVSFGYRADFFFNAMDTGYSVAQQDKRSFHGPFVKLGIGVGD